MLALDSAWARGCHGLSAAAQTTPGERPATVVVVGDGRIGRAFLQMTGRRAVLIRRGESVPEGGEGPVIVATHCSQLDDVLEQTPRSRWIDLVFLQNGMLQPWLAQHKLQQNTQAVLYMSAAMDPSLPHGRVQIASGGRDSLFWGRWAQEVVHIMHQGGLPSSVVTNHDSFLGSMVEKLLWSSIFWVLSSALGGLPVGVIATDHGEDVHDLVAELLPLAKKSERNESSVVSLVREHCKYCVAIETAVPSWDMAVSEFDWRNGWFLREQISPRHLSWLQRACRMSSSSSLRAIVENL